MKPLDLIVLKNFMDSDDQKFISYDVLNQNKKLLMEKRLNKKISVTFNLVASQHYTDTIPLGDHDSAIKLLYLARLMGCTYYKETEQENDRQMVDAILRKTPGIQRSRS